jgi:hypothetical protein
VGGLLLIEIIRFQTHLIAPGSTYLHFFTDRVVLLLVGSYALLGISRGLLLATLPRGAALLWLVGVVAHKVALLPLGAACPSSCCPAPPPACSVVSLGAGIVATSSGDTARQTLKSGFVDLPAMFLYSRPKRGVSFA